jgi:hypothetical protein
MLSLRELIPLVAHSTIVDCPPYRSLEVIQFEERIRLPTQIVSDRHTNGSQTRYDCDVRTDALECFYQGTKIAIPGKQKYVVYVFRNLDCIDYKFDTNIALKFAPALTVIELLDRVRTHRKSVVLKPIDERPGRLKFFSDDGVIKCTHKHTAPPERGKKPLEIDAEIQGFCRVVEAQAVDKERQFFGRKNRPSSIADR